MVIHLFKVYDIGHWVPIPFTYLLSSRWMGIFTSPLAMTMNFSIPLHGLCSILEHMFLEKGSSPLWNPFISIPGMCSTHIGQNDLLEPWSTNSEGYRLCAHQSITIQHISDRFSRKWMIYDIYGYGLVDPTVPTFSSPQTIFVGANKHWAATSKRCRSAPWSAWFTATRRCSRRSCRWVLVVWNITRHKTEQWNYNWTLDMIYVSFLETHMDLENHQDVCLFQSKQ